MTDFYMQALNKPPLKDRLSPNVASIMPAKHHGVMYKTKKLKNVIIKLKYLGISKLLGGISILLYATRAFIWLYGTRL